MFDYITQEEAEALIEEYEAAGFEFAGLTATRSGVHFKFGNPYGYWREVTITSQGSYEVTATGDCYEVELPY